MSGSGKQILLHVLGELSTAQLPEDKLQDATRRVRAGLLFHGSTAEESIRYAGRLEWGNIECSGELIRQGLMTKDSKYPIADLFEALCEMPSLKEYLLAECEELQDSEVDACLWAISVLVSSVQMFTELRETEASSDVGGFESMIVKMVDIYEKMASEID